MTEPTKKESAGPKKRHRGAKIVIGLVVLLVAAVAALLLIPAHEYVPAYGNVLSADGAVLRTGSKGPIRSILAKSGQQVERGQTLIELESQVEETDVVRCERVLAEAEAEFTLIQAQQQIERSQDRIELGFVKIKLADAQGEYRRVQKLHAQRVASDRELQTAKMAHELAKADRDRSALDRRPIREATLEVHRRKIGTLKAQLQQARSVLARRKVQAPLGGMVVMQNLSVGQVVDANEVLGEIFDNRYFQIYARVPERYAPLLKKGQEIIVELSAYPKWHFGYCKAQLYWEPLVVNPHDSGDGSLRIKARLTETPPGVALKPGMSAQLWVNLGRTRLLWKLLAVRTYKPIAQDGPGNE